MCVICSSWSNYVMHLCSSGTFRKMRGVLKVQVTVILHRQRYGGLARYAMTQEWPRSYKQRHIARGAITSICTTRRSTSRSTMIVFIDPQIGTSRIV
jgi:hypothetical protein